MHSDHFFLPCLSFLCNSLYPFFAPYTRLLSSLVSGFHLFSAGSSFYTPIPSCFLICCSFHLLHLFCVCVSLFILSPYTFFSFSCVSNALPPTFLSLFLSLSFFLQRYCAQFCLKTLTLTFLTNSCNKFQILFFNCLWYLPSFRSCYLIFGPFVISFLGLLVSVQLLSYKLNI